MSVSVFFSVSLYFLFYYIFSRSGKLMPNVSPLQEVANFGTAFFLLRYYFLRNANVNLALYSPFLVTAVTGCHFIFFPHHIKLRSASNYFLCHTNFLLSASNYFLSNTNLLLSASNYFLCHTNFLRSASNYFLSCTNLLRSTSYFLLCQTNLVLSVTNNFLSEEYTFLSNTLDFLS